MHICAYMYICRVVKWNINYRDMYSNPFLNGMKHPIVYLSTVQSSINKGRLFALMNMKCAKMNKHQT